MILAFMLGFGGGVPWKSRDRRSIAAPSGIMKLSRKISARFWSVPEIRQESRWAGLYSKIATSTLELHVVQRE